MWADAAISCSEMASGRQFLCFTLLLSEHSGVSLHCTSYTASCGAIYEDSVCLIVNASLKLVKGSKTYVVYMLAELSALALLIVSPSPWLKVSRQPSDLRPEPSAALSGLLHKRSIGKKP